ncbi:hypothetical protein [Kineococcus aurantiacus]|uniref:hypothetical protein n=1 Tax=Kineococcus aurantiacus TaxID=37633 RepID=UPI0031D61859
MGTCKAAKAAGYGPYAEGQDPEYALLQGRRPRRSNMRMNPAPSDDQSGAAAGGQAGGQPATLQRLLTLRQYQQNGLRAPHKSLLVMLVLTRLLTTGTSSLTWLEARRELAALRLSKSAT